MPSDFDSDSPSNSDSTCLVANRQILKKLMAPLEEDITKTRQRELRNAVISNDVAAEIEKIKKESNKQKTYVYAFDEVCVRLAYFVYRQPIVDRAIIDALRSRLLAQGHNVISTDDIAGRGRDGLQSCSCHHWIKYAWCECAFADARRKKIILKLNIGLDPNLSLKTGPASTKITGDLKIHYRQGGRYWKRQRVQGT